VSYQFDNPYDDQLCAGLDGGDERALSRPKLSTLNVFGVEEHF